MRGIKFIHGILKGDFKNVPQINAMTKNYKKDPTKKNVSFPESEYETSDINTDYSDIEAGLSEQNNPTSRSFLGMKKTAIPDQATQPKAQTI